MGAKLFTPKSANRCHFWAVLGSAFKDEEITLSQHEFIFVVFHWGDIVSKVLSKEWGLEKRWKGGDGYIGEVAHRRGERGGGVQTCTLWKCIFQHFSWVEDQKVSERIVKIWPSIIKIMNHWMSLPPSKQPKCESYEAVKVRKLSRNC